MIRLLLCLINKKKKVLNVIKAKYDRSVNYDIRDIILFPPI